MTCRLEKYAQGSVLMNRVLRLPTGFYHLSKDQLPELEFHDDDQFVIYHFHDNNQKDKFYHLSFRRDVFESLAGRNILMCEVLCFDQHFNPHRCPKDLDLKMVREIRRESYTDYTQTADFEINLEIKLRREMRDTVYTTPPELTMLSSGWQEKSTVHVHPFPRQMTVHEIYQFCEIYGKVVSIKLQRDNVGHSMGQAIVDFADSEMASAFAYDIDGMLFCGRVLSVRLRPRTSHPAAGFRQIAGSRGQQVLPLQA